MSYHPCYELRHSGTKYKSAIPVLLRWLPKVAYSSLKEDIIRTLSVPWAKPEATPILLEEFKNIEDPTGTGLRWVIGNALEVLVGRLRVR